MVVDERVETSLGRGGRWWMVTDVRWTRRWRLCHAFGWSACMSSQINATIDEEPSHVKMNYGEFRTQYLDVQYQFKVSRYPPEVIVSNSTRTNRTFQPHDRLTRLTSPLFLSMLDLYNNTRTATNPPTIPTAPPINPFDASLLCATPVSVPVLCAAVVLTPPVACTAG